jgi:serine/threonine protein kinase
MCRKRGFTIRSVALEVGQVFAGYTIVRVLGAGGMGSVYLASHPRLPRQDALKVLPADLTADAEFRARFEREDGQFWISMDYVAGTDAGRLLRDNYPGGMPIDDVVSIVTAVGSALDYAEHAFSRRLIPD